MSIKIDPDTQKAVDPESIGKDMPKRAIYAVLVTAVVIIAWKVVSNILQ
jgi:hypothetical protein